MASNPLILNGAGGGSRTHTRLPLPDFESGASAISPHRQRNDFPINQSLRKCHSVSCSISKCQNCSHFASNLQAASFNRLSTIIGCNLAKKLATGGVQVIDAGIEPAYPIDRSHFTSYSITKAKPTMFSQHRVYF